MAIPVAARVVWSQPTDEASIEDPIELLGGLVLIGPPGALILSGVAVLLWPIAVAMLFRVLVAFGVADLYILVLATRRAYQAISARRCVQQTAGQP